MRRSEIYGLKRTARRAFADAGSDGRGWMFSWLGVGVSASLSLCALLGVANQTVVTGVIAGHVALIVIGFFLAGYLGWSSRKARETSGAAEDEFLAELDQLDERAPSGVTD